jgi:hypothetical protein
MHAALGMRRAEIESTSFVEMQASRRWDNPVISSVEDQERMSDVAQSFIGGH